MKKVTVFILSLGVCGLCESVYAHAEDAGELFKQTCTQCHSTNRITSKLKTKHGWEKTTGRMFKKMVNQYLEAEDEDKKIMQAKAERLSGYLYKQFGYKNPKTGNLKARERKDKFREKFPPTEARTVSPAAKTVR